VFRAGSEAFTTGTLTRAARLCQSTGLRRRCVRPVSTEAAQILQLSPQGCRDLSENRHQYVDGCPRPLVFRTVSKRIAYGEDSGAEGEMTAGSDDRQEIEFIGGPFDGFRYDVPLPLLPPSTIALPVSDTIQRMLTGENTGQPTPATSVALYRFDVARSRYRFLGSTTPETLRAAHE
jgi:hypothetical protein